MRDQRASSQRKPYFKYGCFGCLGCLGISVLVVGGIALAALLLGPPEKNFVQPEIERVLPGSASSDRGTEPPVGELTPPPPGELTPPPGVPGRIVLDLHGGEFQIVPGEPGQPVRIEGNYNAGGFELLEELDPQGQDGWTYSIAFSRGVSWVRMLYGDQHEENRIRITLPRGVPFYLEGQISTGVSNLELGGLSVLGVDLDLSMGDHSFGFDEPTPEPMEQLKLRARMGEFGVRQLGNASPARVHARGRMGEFQLDLRGPWQNDTEVTARWKMGEFVVRVPEGVRIDAESAGVFLGASDTRALRQLPEPPTGAPTMQLNLGGSMGEVRLAR
jgi:hypothetical protein